MDADLELRDRLTRDLCMTTLAYLSYILNCLKDLNLNLQGKATNRSSVDVKIKFEWKLAVILQFGVNFVTEHDTELF